MPSFLSVVLLTATVLGLSSVRGNLLEEIDAGQSQQSVVPVASSGVSQVASELNSAEGLRPFPDAPQNPAQSGNAPRQGGCGNGPALSLAPGAYIQFKVAVPPGFIARMDDSPDGGKVITVISPEPPCPKCDKSPGPRGFEQQQSSGMNSFDSAPQPYPGMIPGSSNAKVVQNYQESSQMVRSGGVQTPSSGPVNYAPQYPDQSLSSTYVKNSAYRNVQISGASQVAYPARSSQNFVPPPPPPVYQRPQPPPQPQAQPQPQPQRVPQYQQQQYQPPPQGHYQQQMQYNQVNNAQEYPPPQRQQQQQQQQQQQPPQQVHQQQQPSSSGVQYLQQASDSQVQYNSPPQLPPPQPQQSANVQAAAETFHKALRSLDDDE